MFPLRAVRLALDDRSHSRIRQRCHEQEPIDIRFRKAPPLAIRRPALFKQSSGVSRQKQRLKKKVAHDRARQ